MAIYISGKLRYDTRGLPEGMDPHKFYEYHTLVRANTADGVEGLLYRLMPVALIRSFAFAIDPFSKFKVSPEQITPPNRKRQRYRTRQPRTVKVTHSFRYLEASDSNYMGIPGAVGPVQISSTSYPPVTTLVGAYWGTNVFDETYDTTKRTRLFGSRFGEFDLFTGDFLIPARTVHSRTIQRARYTSNLPPPSYRYRFHNSVADDIDEFPNGSAVLSGSTYPTLRTSEKAYNLAVMQENALSMYKGFTPFQRNYTLFRNIVELRDIPRSVVSLRAALSELVRIDKSLKHNQLREVFNLGKQTSILSNEWLSYNFGWRQLYSDITSLLSSPEKIAKQINFLMSRSGKNTTYRSKRTLTSRVSNVSGFEIYKAGGDAGPNTVSTDLERQTELRMVINAVFDFPPIDLPSFKRTLFLNKLGAFVTPTDLYNLVPWTWLIDWFTGLGNYVEVMDTVNRDPTTINYGFLTCSTRGKLITTYNTSERTSYQFPDGSQSSYSTLRKYTYTPILEYHCENRRDMATLFDVASISTGKGLTPYQQSILGALLRQRTNFRTARS